MMTTPTDRAAIAAIAAAIEEQKRYEEVMRKVASVNQDFQWVPANVAELLQQAHANTTKVAASLQPIVTSAAATMIRQVEETARLASITVNTRIMEVLKSSALTLDHRADIAAQMSRLSDDLARVRNMTMHVEVPKVVLAKLQYEAMMSDVTESVAKKLRERAADPAPARKVALPPAHRMTRFAGFLFFFSRGMPRAFEELIADFQYQMIDAEARGRPSSELRRLQIKYWGAFFWSLGDQFVFGIVGRIWKVLKGG